MAIGPGKYDDTCTKVRKETNAEGVAIIVMNGKNGSGFSCQAPIELTIHLPQMLRQMADNIEKSS